MSQPASLEQVIVVPRNGYANRLQAWASAAILAAQVDIPLRVLWEPEPVAPATALDLFAASTVARAFIGQESFSSAVGCTHDQLPRYLTRRPGVISLAGHDRGEQSFMPALAELLRTKSDARTLVIIAGGKYHLPGDSDFIRQRQIFYDSVAWSAALDARVGGALQGRGAFAGLHIRQTDRSREAPTRRAVRAGLRQLRESTPITSLFIAADTASGRDRWTREAAALGFVPWSLPDADFDRSRADAGLDALADWRIMAATEALVHPAASTFSEEAAVASGHHDRAIGLVASPARQNLRSIRDVGESAITFPARRLRERRGLGESHGQPGVDG